MSLADDAMGQIGSLLQENTKLRARAEAAEKALAEMRERIGFGEQLSDEWAVRWQTAGGRDQYEPCIDEQDARESVPDDDDTYTVVRRIVSKWKPADG